MKKLSLLFAALLVFVQFCADDHDYDYNNEPPIPIEESPCTSYTIEATQFTQSIIDKYNSCVSDNECTNYSSYVSCWHEVQKGCAQDIEGGRCGFCAVSIRADKIDAHNRELQERMPEFCQGKEDICDCESSSCAYFTSKCIEYKCTVVFENEDAGPHD